MRYAFVHTPLGALVYAGGASGLRHVILPTGADDDPHLIATHYFPECAYDPFLLPQLADQLDHYFAGVPAQFQVTVDLSLRSSFHQRVLLACFSIPFGQTCTYADLAKISGFEGAARAVGMVLASNPVPIVVPCHRVLRSDGKLGGFSAPGGTQTKKWLLDHEAQCCVKEPLLPVCC